MLMTNGLLAQMEKDIEDKVKAIEFQGKKITPFLNYYIDYAHQEMDIEKPVKAFIRRPFKPSSIFKDAIRVTKHKDMTQKIMIDVYKEIKFLLTHKTSPSTLLKATLLMREDLTNITQMLNEKKISVQSHVIKRQFTLFFSLLYLELFGSRSTAVLLEPLFEKNNEHPYILDTHADDYDYRFGNLVEAFYKAFEGYNGLSESLKYLFLPLEYDNNVNALNELSVTHGETFDSMELNNGNVVRPIEYFLFRNPKISYPHYLEETFKSFRYMRPVLIDRGDYYIVSPLVKALIETDLNLEYQSFTKKYERVYIASISAQDVPFDQAEHYPLKAKFFQIGNRYYVQRSSTNKTCRYCDYIYPLSPYAIKDIKDLSHPTDEEISQLLERCKHIFRMGGI